MECYKLNYADLRKENLSGKEWVNIYNPKIYGSELDFAKIAPDAKKIELSHIDSYVDLNFGPKVEDLTLWNMNGIGHIDFAKIAPNVKKVSFPSSHFSTSIWFGENVEEIDLSDTFGFTNLDFAKIAPNVKKLNLLDTRFDLRGKISVPSTTELCLGGMGLQDTYISSTELKNGILHMYLSRRR